MFRILSPVQRSDASQTLDVDRYLLNWNLRNPDKAWGPEAMDRRIERNINGKRVSIYLPAAEYEEMSHSAGQAAKRVLAQGTYNPIAPTEEGLKEIKETFQKTQAAYRALVKERHTAEFLDLYKKQTSTP